MQSRKFEKIQILCRNAMKEIPGILSFLEKSESDLIWESHQKQGINIAGLRTKSPLMLEIIWSQVTGFE